MSDHVPETPVYHPGASVGFRRAIFQILDDVHDHPYCDYPEDADGYIATTPLLRIHGSMVVTFKDGDT